METATLTLGPLLFNWPAEAWSDFYARVADEAPVDRVCLGEVVCSKRLPFYADRVMEAVERLERAGKEVILSTLALVTLKRERSLTRGLVSDAEPLIEVNDLTALSYLRDEQAFVVGPMVNVYNEATLHVLAGEGAVRICLPPELPLSSIDVLGDAAAKLDVPLEVWAFGRIPLALSGRCYHARVHGLTKDACQFVCGEDPDGLEVDTLDGERFLAINGIQTLSASYANLLRDLTALRRAGIASFRLSPHRCDMVAVTELFRRTLDGMLEPEAATQELGKVIPDAAFSNGFLAGAYGAAYGP